MYLIITSYIASYLHYYLHSPLILFIGASTPTRAHFGQGTGQIWLDNVACTGTEARLIDCAANPLGSHNCDHSEDVGTRCIPVFSEFFVQYKHRLWR